MMHPAKKWNAARTLTLLALVVTSALVVAPSDASATATPDENAITALRIAPGNLVDMRLQNVVTPLPFHGRASFRLGDQDPVLVDVDTHAGEQIDASAQFVARDGDTSVSVSLVTLNNSLALRISGNVTSSGTLRLDEGSLLDHDLVTLPAGSTTLLVSSGTVDGTLVATISYASWSGARRAELEVSPVGNASDPNATLQRQTFTGEGPVLVAPLTVKHSPVTVRYTLRVLDGERTLFTATGEFSWLQSTQLAVKGERTPDAARVIRTVTVRPTRDSNVSAFEVSAALLTREVAPSAFDKLVDPYGVQVLLCDEPCPEPEPPLGVRVARFFTGVWSFAVSNLPTIALVGGALTAGAVWALSRRSRAAAYPAAAAAVPEEPETRSRSWRERMEG